MDGRLPMNLPLARMYRLAPRGGGGLACDNAGVALGAVDLVRVSAPTRRDDDGAMSSRRRDCGES
jgi:hypothetical protein